MVTHVSRCVPHALDHILNEMTFTFTVHDEYKELKGFNKYNYINLNLSWTRH